MLLFIDNHDSFTYNIVHCLLELGANVKVVRNHVLSVQESLALSPTKILIGPGPGTPSQAGVSKELMIACQHSIPILGICLGHQALGEIYGGHTIRAHYPMHGKTSPMYHDGKGVFRSIPQGFNATRYHSLIVDPTTLPSELVISASTKEGEIMGLRHRDYPLESVQFHPESILSEYGMVIFRNFLTGPHG